VPSLERNHFLTKDNVRIYYEIRRNRLPCLVFLHGLGGNLTAWREEIKYYSSHGFSNIAIDLRGHGKSERPMSPSAYTFEKLANDVVQILEHENLKKYILVGHCYGGMVAMTAQALHPSLAQCLILVDSAHKLPWMARLFLNKIIAGPAISFLAQSLPDYRIEGEVNFSNFKGTGDWNFRRLASDILHTSLKSYLLNSRNLVGYDASELVKKIEIPTLIIEGRNDTVFPPSLAMDLNSRIKTSVTDFIPNANHILVINNPQELNREILNFLNLVDLK
jgi:pimeloyl-ACP methyl ester carboxylesterase